MKLPIKPVVLDQSRARGRVARFTPEQVWAMREAYEAGASIRGLRREFGGNYQTVVNALTGKGAYKGI